MRTVPIEKIGRLQRENVPSELVISPALKSPPLCQIACTFGLFKATLIQKAVWRS